LFAVADSNIGVMSIGESIGSVPEFVD